MPDGVASVFLALPCNFEDFTVLPSTRDYESCKPLTQLILHTEIEPSSGIQLSVSVSGRTRTGAREVGNGMSRAR